MPTSLIPATRNTTPSSTPTVAIEVELRRRTIQAISNHKIPRDQKQPPVAGPLPRDQPLLRRHANLKGAQMRSCSLPVLTEEAAEQVASVYNALVILAQDSQRGRQSGGCSPAPGGDGWLALGCSRQTAGPADYPGRG